MNSVIISTVLRYRGRRDGIDVARCKVNREEICKVKQLSKVGGKVTRHARLRKEDVKQERARYWV